MDYITYDPQPYDWVQPTVALSVAVLLFVEACFTLNRWGVQQRADNETEAMWQAALEARVDGDGDGVFSGSERQALLSFLQLEDEVLDPKKHGFLVEYCERLSKPKVFYESNIQGVLLGPEHAHYVVSEFPTGPGA